MAIFSKKEEQAKDTPAVKTAAAPSSTVFAGVLVQPRISEKAVALSHNGKYVFRVLKTANKVEIKKAVERTYKVTVTAVNIVNVKGKTRNYGRIAGKTSGFKKAVVTLKKGDKIESPTETI